MFGVNVGSVLVKRVPLLEETIRFRSLRTRAKLLFLLGQRLAAFPSWPQSQGLRAVPVPGSSGPGGHSASGGRSLSWSNAGTCVPPCDSINLLDLYDCTCTLQYVHSFASFPALDKAETVVGIYLLNNTLCSSKRSKTSMTFFGKRPGAPPNSKGGPSGRRKLATLCQARHASTAAATGSFDTGISRTAADYTAVGNGTAADTSGKVKAAGYMSVGTTFTTNAGCGEGALVGGATAGKITTAGSTSCTDIITMGNSATAPNGWQCSFTDLTTAGDAANPHETASTATTVTWVSGTIVAADVVSFGCVGY